MAVYWDRDAKRIFSPVQTFVSCFWDRVDSESRVLRMGQCVKLSFEVPGFGHWFRVWVPLGRLLALCLRKQSELRCAMLEELDLEVTADGVVSPISRTGYSCRFRRCCREAASMGFNPGKAPEASTPSCRAHGTSPSPQTPIM